MSEAKIIDMRRVYYDERNYWRDRCEQAEFKNKILIQVINELKTQLKEEFK